MGRDKNNKGAVVDNYKGYNIRQMVTKKETPGDRRGMQQHTGEYGIYAGKNLCKQFKKLDKCREDIDEMVLNSIRLSKEEKQKEEKKHQQAWK